MLVLRTTKFSGFIHLAVLITESKRTHFYFFFCLFMFTAINTCKSIWSLESSDSLDVYTKPNKFFRLILSYFFFRFKTFYFYYYYMTIGTVRVCLLKLTIFTVCAYSFFFEQAVNIDGTIYTLQQQQQQYGERNSLYVLKPVSYWLWQTIRIVYSFTRHQLPQTLSHTSALALKSNDNRAHTMNHRYRHF